MPEEIGAQVPSAQMQMPLQDGFQDSCLCSSLSWYLSLDSPLNLWALSAPAPKSFLHYRRWVYDSIKSLLSILLCGNGWMKIGDSPRVIILSSRRWFSPLFESYIRPIQGGREWCAREKRNLVRTVLSHAYMSWIPKRTALEVGLWTRGSWDAQIANRNRSDFKSQSASEIAAKINSWSVAKTLRG